MNVDPNFYVAAGRSLTVALGATLVLGAAGCGGTQKSAVALVPAYGKVTVDGTPLADAVLEFIPVGETRGQGGIALTDADGLYRAKTNFGEPGLPAGEYKVVVSKREEPGGKYADEDFPPASVGPEGETLSASYSDPKKTKLKASVPPSGEANNNFALQASRKAAKR